MLQRRWLMVTIGAFMVMALSIGAAWFAEAQPGGKKKGDKKGGFGTRPAETEAAFLGKIFAFDKDKNGSLTKDEVYDTRLHGLLERADSNKDGSVSREELQALFARENVTASGFGFFPGKGPDGKGDKKGPPPSKDRDR